MGGPSRDELEAENARLGARVRELEDTIDSQAAVLAANEERFKKLEEIIEKLRRGGKRQAAPFSKGDPVLDPKKPGRKPGAAHGRHAHRPTPEAVDRELVAPLPSCCPDCGGDVEFERWAEQFLTELPDARPTVTRFKVGIGHCGACRRRVKGRHPEQTSDALGAAAVGLGPRARAMAHWLHYVLGLSFAKTAKVLGELGVGVTPAALVLAAQSTGRAL
ncbi:MAG: hypothetical protein M3137_08640, partial [Actinomycetota bacterium]|nr:hypothetical protein [Actinomycetota bacterium]